MRGFMTLVALAGLLLVGNSLLDNTSAPIQAEAPSLPTPIIESSPSDKCCGDDCDCCEQCPCNSVLSVAVEPVVEVVAEVPEPQPQPKPAAYAIGADIRTASGAIETVTKVENINGNWAYFTQPKSVSVSVSTPVTYSSGYYNGTSQWTYPGDIRSHLSTSHGTTATAGMSQNQMESLHDSIHNGTRTYSQPVVRPVVRVQSNCPGGVCPQPRRLFFRR